MSLRRILMTIIAVLVLLTSSLPVSAQSNPPHTPYLVKDINTCSKGSLPYEFYDANGIVYFQANTANEGTELWRTDETEAGTYLVADLNPGTASSYPRDFYMAGNFLYFIAGTDLQANDDRYIWKLDLTTEETTLVRDFSTELSANPDSQIKNFTYVGGKIYFLRTAQSLFTVGQIWLSDGTSAGTQLVDGAPIGNGELTAFNNLLYFIGDSEKNLWKTDGTSAGTQIIKTFSRSKNLTVAGNSLFFTATTDGSTWKIWHSDGTFAGTQEVSGSPKVSANTNIAVAGDKLYFSGEESDSSYELWSLQLSLPSGDPGSASLVKNINPSSGSGPNNFKTVNNTVLFYANDGTYGSRIWRSDGTEAGTYIISTENIENSNPIFTIIKSNEYYLVYVNGANQHTWITDGTLNNTYQLTDKYFQNSKDMTYNQTRMISIGAVACSGGEPLLTELPSQEKHLIKDIYVSNESSTPTSGVAEYNHRVYFFTFNETDRYELWSTDGTDAGTSKVLNLNLDKNLAISKLEYVQANGLLFIILRDTSSYITLLWRTDGTAEGTWQIAKITQDCPESAFEPVSYKNQLFFIQDSSLWATNGNSHALYKSLLKFEPFFDKYKGPYEMNGLLYFLLGNQLWQSDGTAAGTQKVTTLEGFTQNYEFMPVCSGKLLYFVGKTSASGDELWVTDGSASGTKMVSDLTSGTGSTQFKTHVQADGSLFFVTSKDQTQTLWVTKGGSSDVQKLVEQPSITMKGASGNRAYFTVGDSSAKYSIWQSDGTSAGTKSLFNINYQYASLEILAKTIFFGNTDEASGNEIWVYDGSSSPRLLADIYPGADPTGYTRNSSMGIAAGKLWITANDGVHGRELWAYDILTSSLYLPDITR